VSEVIHNLFCFDICSFKLLELSRSICLIFYDLFFGILENILFWHFLLSVLFWRLCCTHLCVCVRIFCTFPLCASCTHIHEDRKYS
jgi:hypothetical protein